MKPRTLTVRDYVRAFSIVMTPIANGLTKAMTVNEYISGRDQRGSDSHTFNATPGVTRHPPRRPWQQWPLENTWGYDSESERFECELWMEQTFHDADFGVTYGESTWDGRWKNDEWWRR